MPKPRCPYCRSHMKKMRGKHGPYIECLGADCDARVGLHPNGKPKGTPARFHERKWRMAAHLVFDALWKGDARNVPLMSRSDAYDWLRQVTGIEHIAECDVEQCFEVINAVRQHHRGLL